MTDENNKGPCVYAIRSKINKRVYIGQTVFLDRRLLQHNLGRVKSTRGDTPWDVFAVEYVADQAKARWIERQLKRSKGSRLAWVEKNKQ